MLKEAIDHICQLARAATQIHVLHPPQEPDYLYLIRQHDGTITVNEADPLPRDHKAASLQAIVDFAKASPKSAIWYSRNGVVCYIDDEKRRDTVSLDLRQSVQMEKLCQFETQRVKLKHDQFVRLLRVDFEGCGNDKLLPLVRRLRFQSGQIVDVDVGHSKASIGKQIQSEVTGDADIPEYVTFTVPLFANGFLFHAAVRCSLEVDAEEATFTLQPLPRQIELAKCSGELQILDELKSRLGPPAATAHQSDTSIREVPVYYGVCE